MAEHCKNCGLELFTAQRFCRSCGTPTEQLSEEQVPTRMMPPLPDSWGARSAGTAPTSRPQTSPVYDPPPMGYQPSVPPPYPAIVPPYVPPRKRSPIGWILAFIGMGLFVLVVVAVMMMARFRSRPSDSREIQTTQSRQGERLLDESTADTVTILGNDTTFTKAFSLGDEARLSVKNVNGNITVGVWDEPKAEVKVIRRSSSDRNTQVFFSNNGGNLSIRTAQTRGNQDVRIEVRVPREVGRVEVSSANGTIKLSDVAAEILVDATNGAIELTNVVRASKVHTVNGSIKASLVETSDRSMEFDSTNGAIDITVPPGFEADLEASTVHGSIKLDDTFGVEIEKGIVGQKARGEIGKGGERLKLSTVNGTIKIGIVEPPAIESAKQSTKGTTKGKQNGN